MQVVKIDLNSKLWQWLVLLALALVWGSSFILMKRGLVSFTNGQVAAYRIFISFLILLPLAWKNVRHLRGKYLIPVLLVGYLGNCIPAFLFTRAQTVIESAFAGMLNSLVPTFALILGISFFGMKLKWAQVGGIVLGLCGAVGLMLANGISELKINMLYGGYVVVATIMYAITVNIIKRYLHDLNAKAITSLAFLLCGPPQGGRRAF